MYIARLSFWDDASFLFLITRTPLTRTPCAKNTDGEGRGGRGEICLLMQPLSSYSDLSMERVCAAAFATTCLTCVGARIKERGERGKKGRKDKQLLPSFLPPPFFCYYKNLGPFLLPSPRQCNPLPFPPQSPSWDPFTD